MHYSNLLSKHGSEIPVRAVVVGTGAYATAIVAQARSVPALTAQVICDDDVEAAIRAFARAGIDPQDCVVCSSQAAAERELAAGKSIIVTDARVAFSLPTDIMVEASGDAESASSHAMLALEKGLHVAMTTTAADATVGPILRREANAAGLVYTAVDGDQHGLLIQLVDWAQRLGFEVLCAGKALDFDAVVDHDAGTLDFDGDLVVLDASAAGALQPWAPNHDDRRAERLAARDSLLGRRVTPFDLAGMAVVANATGLVPDTPALHCPTLRTRELPGALCAQDDGGMLAGDGRLECVVNLRDSHEPGLGGGVFVVVYCPNDYSRGILEARGAVCNESGTTAMLYRPWHLCGVEAPTSLLAAVQLGVATAPGDDYAPRYDLHARAGQTLSAGDTIDNPVENDRRPRVDALLQPARRLGPKSAVPLHLATGRVLKREVAAGEIVTLDAIARPAQSQLWSLRELQDRTFWPA